MRGSAREWALSEYERIEDGYRAGVGMEGSEPVSRFRYSPESLAADEQRFNAAVWANRAVLLVLACFAVTFIVISEADQLWKFFVFPLIAGVPVIYGIISARYMRLMHVDMLRRYQGQLVLRAAELEEMASRDEMTGLYNRRHFYQILQTEVANTRVSKDALALMLLDLDGLKSINDEHGHMVGDDVLANIGKAIAKHTRGVDVAARLGGDEFGVIMPGTDKRGAFALARRLWEELEETPMSERDGKRVMATISIGVSGFPWGGEDADEMMHWADSDMYANKISRRLPPQPVAVDASSELAELDHHSDDYRA
jgi:diguanylate cyclase (GGDEF)-like protein